MALFITEGLGAGQYGYIDTYSSQVKLLQLKNSDNSAGWDTLSGKAVEATLIQQQFMKLPQE